MSETTRVRRFRFAGQALGPGIAIDMRRSDARLKQHNVLKNLEATGVWPMDAEVILERFNTTTSGKMKIYNCGSLEMEISGVI
jgi:hypothetical protein